MHAQSPIPVTCSGNWARTSTLRGASAGLNVGLLYNRIRISRILPKAVHGRKQYTAAGKLANNNFNGTKMSVYVSTFESLRVTSFLAQSLDAVCDLS